MQTIKRLLEGFAKWLIALIGADGLLHIIVSFIGATLFWLVLREPMPAALAMLFVGFAKELLIDAMGADGEISYSDLACNSLGICLMLLNHI